jgi:hypothetical protein
VIRWPVIASSRSRQYNLFIFEVVKAHVAKSPKHPEMLHYEGDGVFMVSGKIISRRSQARDGVK